MIAQRWGVLGGGFGIYGYIPALAANPLSRITIIKKHFGFINARPELNQYLPLIDFVDTHEEILSNSESLVISVPPLIQIEYVLEAELKKFKYLVLEKPLAETPTNANKVLERGISQSNAMRIGYSFVYTLWAKDILENLEKFDKNSNIEINWNFFAHYFKLEEGSWKADHKQGGGPLRFYGIQLIALLACSEKVEVKNATIVVDEFERAYKWNAEFIAESGVKIQINLNCRSEVEEFEIRKKSKNINSKFSIKNPFYNETPKNGDDKRSGILRRIINSLEEDNQYYYEIYSRINKLWNEVESKVKWQK